MDFALAALGLVILVIAGDVLVRGAVNISLRLGVPALIVSLTIVAIGTSAPELLIAIDAVLNDAPGIAMGNVVGSNTANVLFVLGVPALLAGLGTEQIRDYAAGTITSATGETRSLSGPQTDMVMIDLDREGNYVAVRPSGTEPKVKFYLFTYEPIETAGELISTKAMLAKRIADLADNLRAYAGVE